MKYSIYISTMKILLMYNLVCYIYIISSKLRPVKYVHIRVQLHPLND